MRATPPYVDVPGDNAAPVELPDGSELRTRIMGRSGDCVGSNAERAVWRFGFTAGSEAAHAYGVSLPEDFHGFLWVLATRKTGKVLEICRCWAVELPANFGRVIDS